MPAPGTRLGVYEITAAIGAGGMGEVYRGRDTRLHRDVAIKILPDVFAADPGRMARFEREAQVLAALNHPNIAQIYGVENAALIMEFVDGEDLAQRIARGAVPVDESIAIARQIAEALEAAHDQGIVHRDLKPANVKVRPDGTVKVLDFGLARQDDATRTSNAPFMPTVTSPIALSAVGMVLGTAAYMAPEQARGKAVDRRADVWAFGGVLYELLTGVRAFGGDNVTDTLAAIVTSEPDWSKLPAATPPAVLHMLRRCLDRDVKTRLQSIGEARIVLSNPSVLKPPTARPSGPPYNRTMLIAASLVMAALGVAAGWWFKPATSPPREARRFDLTVAGLNVAIDRPPVVSPNGRMMAYVADGRVWIRPMDDFASKEIAGSEGAVYPFWSPDSEQIGFLRAEKLWRASVGGGEPSAMGAVPGDVGGSGGIAWMPDGDIFVAGSNTVGLFHTSVRGGEGSRSIPVNRQTEIDFHELSALPGGRGLLFTVHRTQAADTIDVVADGQRKTVLQLRGESLRSPVYSSGHLLYARTTTSPGVWAVRFSLDKLEAEGEPFIVVPRAQWPSVATDGTLAVLRPSEQPSELIAVDRGGAVESIGALPGPIGVGSEPQRLILSPDGRRLAIAVLGSAGEDVWSYDLDRHAAMRLSVGAQGVGGVTWDARGDRVILSAFAGAGVWSLYTVPSNEARSPQRLLPQATAPEWPCSVSSDGRWLVYAQNDANGRADLWLAPLDGSAAPKTLMTTPFHEEDARFSPNGRWLAYTSDESGRAEVYVRSFPISTDRIRVSSDGGFSPAWSSDGQGLFFRAASAVMIARIAERGTTPEVAAAERVTAVPSGRVLPTFVVADGGRRFIFARVVGDDRLSVLLNWSANRRAR